MKIKQGLLKFISPGVSPEARLRAARLEADDALDPADQVTILFALSYDKDQMVSEAAKKTFEAYPTERFLEALEHRLDPAVIRRIVSLHKETDAVLIMAALNEGSDDETLKAIAETGPEEVIAVFIEDREGLRQRPSVIEGLRKNPLTPKSALNELGLLDNNPGKDERIQGVRKREEARRPSPKELVEEKPARTDDQNIYNVVKNMTMGQKIKLAITGNKSVREFLVKDTNKIISMAVLKNPRITEDEVSRLTASKGTPEDILRQIAMNKDWLKSYNIKLGMVTNPKTPLTVSIKLLDHLYEKDLEKLAKSKNIPSVVASTARRKLEAKKK